MQRERGIFDPTLAVMIAQTHCPSGRFRDEERRDAATLATITGLELCDVRRGLSELRRRSLPFPLYCG